MPGPEECTVEPRTPESLLALATPTAGDAASPVPIGAGLAVRDVPFGAPDGEAVDAETAEVVIATVRHEWACLNANDNLRAFTFYTDGFIRRTFPPETIEEIASGATLDVFGGVTAGTPAAIPAEEQTALIAVMDIERIDDGRVGAFVVVDTFGDPIPVEFNYYVLEETDDGWKLDDYLCFDREGARCG